jgi:signal transduction histidine kinase/ActR/RegA family two-component response regulator
MGLPKITPRLRALAPYAAGMGLAGLAAALQWGMRPWIGAQVPFVFFMLAVVLSATSLGRGPALIVLAVGAASAALLARANAGGGSADLISAGLPVLPRLALFLAVGGVFVLYGGRLRLTFRRAALAERRLSLAQENTGTGVFELDFESDRAFVSASLCQLLEQPVMKGSMELDRWLNALHPNHVEESRRVIEERFARGELRYEREQRIELARGGVRWLLTRVRLEAGPDGRLAQARGATVDITARKLAEERLQGVQEVLRQQVADLERLHQLSQRLVAAGDDLAAPMQALLEVVVELHEVRHGLVTLAAPGGTAHEVIAQVGFEAEGRTGRLVLPPRSEPAPEPAAISDASGGHADDPAYRAMHATHLAAAEAAGLPGLHSVALRGADGAVIGLLSVMVPTGRARSERELRLGELCATTAATVVERQRARVAAAENAKRFAVTLESSSVAFSILEPVRDETDRIIDFRWTYVNTAAARALGRPAGELAGQRIAEALPKAWEAPGLFDNYVNAVERGEPCEFEVLSVATGRGGWFYVIASPLEGSLAVWFADITERKHQTQALQEADRRKDEFLATLAHELRNPLAPIRQAVRIARTSVATADQRQWGLDVIERQVQSMSLLLDDLLDVSRITRGTLLVRRVAATLSAVVDSAVETARPHLEAKRHRLDLSLPASPVELEVDPLRLAQVLGNLLTNAAKYTDPGGQIALRAAIEADSLVIRVSDNGIGLSREQLDRLFVMFSQFAVGAGRSQGGLGIGLALSRGLVELHGGTIEASSAGPGCGSEFTVRLPRSCLAPAAPRTNNESAWAIVHPGDPRRVLVADDNVDAADSLAELLRLGGHEVRVAYDGEQALREFRAFVPAAALLDIGMPRLSGLDVVRAIRKLPRGEEAVLIAITGWGQELDRERALAAGFDHHLTKPMDPNQLEVLLARGRDRRPARARA